MEFLSNTLKKYQSEEFDKICLSGGINLIPKIQDLLESTYNNVKKILFKKKENNKKTKFGA
jgi:DUF1009 family protein